jgi:glycosyltransferase involved in cell wall biosynthesis
VPLITIITVSYNSASTIADTCRSVAAQTHPEIEHLIVDGASKDGTCDIARRHCRPGTRIVSEPDSGIYDAMNKGVRLATGDIIGFLNADDTLADPGVVARIARVMRDTSLDGCFADLLYVNQHDISVVCRRWKTGGCKSSLMALGWIPPHPTFYVRSVVFGSNAPFNTDFQLAADHELMCRLLRRQRIKARHVSEVWVRMRLGGATNRSVRNIIFQNIEIMISLVRHCVGISPMFLIYKLLDRIRQHRFR